MARMAPAHRGGAPAAAQLSNAQARQLFLSTALPRSNMVTPNQSFNPGSVITAQLPAAGVARFLRVAVQIPLTLNVGTGTIVPSAKAPWSIFQNVRLQDYAGIDRINASAYMLGMLDLIKLRQWEPSSQYPYGGANLPSYVYPANWFVPTANGNGTLVFDFVIPLAFGDQDPRGALMQAIPNGRTTLYLTCAPTLSTVTPPATADALYAVTGNDSVALQAGTSPIVTIGYYYWDPVAYGGLDEAQFPGQVPLPFDDLALIHEVRSQTDASNIAGGLEKIWSLQSGRDYYRFMYSVNEAGALSSNHIARTRVVYDGNTPALDEYLQLYEARVKREFGRLLPDGLIAYDFVNRPWDANSYGELGIGTTFSSAFTNTGNTYIEYLHETMYVSSMPNA